MLGSILKPGVFKPRKLEDSEQLLTDFEEYVETFKEFLSATKGDTEEHEADHVNCAACKQLKSMFKLIRGKEMNKLFKHFGKILNTDSFETDYHQDQGRRDQQD